MCTFCHNIPDRTKLKCSVWYLPHPEFLYTTSMSLFCAETGVLVHHVSHTSPIMESATPHLYTHILVLSSMPMPPICVLTASYTLKHSTDTS